MQALNVNVTSINQAVQNQQAYLQTANQPVKFIKNHQPSADDSQKQPNYSRLFEALSDCV